VLKRQPKPIRYFRLLFLTAASIILLALFISPNLTAGSNQTLSPDSPIPGLPSPQSQADDPNSAPNSNRPPKAVVITCADMVDEGMYESIVRRTEAALADGATYIIYQIDTDGGRVDMAVNIWEYFMHDVSKKAHTVAYTTTRAISAGALISVACQDIIMKKATNIGDCAPIMLGGTLEGVEREKMETYIRARFKTAAEINGYPAALCEAMVTAQLKIYQVPIKNTDQFEYFDEEFLPNEDNQKYDVAQKGLIVKEGALLTLSATQAERYGLARTVVEGLDDEAFEQLLSYLEERDDVRFPRPVAVLNTNWSEEMVRWITNPIVSGILLMIGLIAIYVELNSPGLGLPGAVAVAVFIIMFGSKFLFGLANWWEIAVFIIGMGLLVVELFVIPGFGIAGITGVLLIIFALGAMMVNNPPSELPIPKSPVDWEIFEQNVLWSFFGMGFFIVVAYIIGRYMPTLPFANRLILAPAVDSAVVRSGGNAAPAPQTPVKIGAQGLTISPLRPSGMARFGSHRLDVVSRGELIDTDKKIKVVALEGNSIVVKEI